MQFGQFNSICTQNALSVCALLGEQNGIGLQPLCYARNLEVGTSGMLIFQPAALFIRVVTIVMCGIMIFHITSKYTAVGRKEMVTFFYLFLLNTILSMLLVSNLIPMAWTGFRYFVAIDFGITVACFWCLMLNGFISFQFLEDGTRLSVWGVRLSSLGIAALSAFIAGATFQGTAGMRPDNPIALWVMMFIINGVFLLVYVASQIFLVFKTLKDRWPLGDILFGVAFFAIGQVITASLSNTVCRGTKHYLDGTFFNTCAVLLAAMFVYKYWDSITKEDLEFSVGGKQNVWEVKDAVDEEEFAYGPTAGHQHPSPLPPPPHHQHQQQPPYSAGGYGGGDYKPAVGGTGSNHQYGYPAHNANHYAQSTVYGSEVGGGYDQPQYGAPSVHHQPPSPQPYPPPQQQQQPMQHNNNNYGQPSPGYGHTGGY